MYIDIKEKRGQYWLENIMKDRFTVSMFGQKRLSREGGIEIAWSRQSENWQKLGLNVSQSVWMITLARR